jgi:hypothetical protein
MSRLIDQLASVYGDLESRYGSDNEVVLELKSALDHRKAVDNKSHPRWHPLQDQHFFGGSIKTQPGRVKQDL